MTHIKGTSATIRQPPRPAAPPPGRLGRVGAWCYDHRRGVLLGWIAAVIAVIAVASAAGSAFQDDFGGVGQSQQAQNILTQRFPARAGDTAQVVFRSSAPASTPGVTVRVEAALAAIRPLPSIASVTPPVIAPDGHTALASIQFDATSAKLPPGEVKAVIARAQSYDRPGLQVALDGAPVSAVVSPSPGPAKASASWPPSSSCWWPSARSSPWACPSSPRCSAWAGVGVVDLISQVLIVPTFGTELAAMIGIGVGIDYALFIVTRYRQGLAEGLDPRPRWCGPCRHPGGPCCSPAPRW